MVFVCDDQIQEVRNKCCVFVTLKEGQFVFSKLGQSKLTQKPTSAQKGCNSTTKIVIQKLSDQAPIQAAS